MCDFKRRGNTGGHKLNWKWVAFLCACITLYIQPPTCSSMFTRARQHLGMTGIPYLTQHRRSALVTMALSAHTWTYFMAKTMIRPTYFYFHVPQWIAKFISLPLILAPSSGCAHGAWMALEVLMSKCYNDGCCSTWNQWMCKITLSQKRMHETMQTAWFLGSFSA